MGPAHPSSDPMALQQLGSLDFNFSHSDRSCGARVTSSWTASSSRAMAEWFGPVSAELLRVKGM